MPQGAPGWPIRVSTLLAAAPRHRHSFSLEPSCSLSGGVSWLVACLLVERRAMHGVVSCSLMIVGWWMKGGICMHGKLPRTP